MIKLLSDFLIGLLTRLPTSLEYIINELLKAQATRDVLKEADAAVEAARQDAIRMVRMAADAADTHLQSVGKQARDTKAKASLMVPPLSPIAVTSLLGVTRSTVYPSVDAEFLADDPQPRTHRNLA